MCQTSVPDSKLLHNRNVLFVCFQYGVLLGQHFYIPVNRKRYFIMIWHIITASMFVFSSIRRAILANNFVLRSEAALYSVKNVCVSVNKIRSFCQHLLFHPDRTCYFSKVLLFHYDTACYFTEHLLCYAWYDLSLWHTLWRFILIWHTIPANIFLYFVRHALLFRETLSHVLIISANEIHYILTLFW